MGVFEMRELEFRAWDLKACQWEPNLLIRADGAGLQVRFILCQYTGLKDANGVKIFEGDILGGGQSEPREVIFEDGSFRLYDDTSSGNQSIVPRSANRLKVIGNIYETPELLK
jgi:hypothetical protein